MALTAVIGTVNAKPGNIQPGAMVAVATMAVTAPVPAQLVANTASNVVTVTGTNTAWASGTTWSVSGLAGAAVTAKSFTDATHYTLTLTSSTANVSGTLTLSDSADAATCTLAVYSTSGVGARGARQVRRWRS